MAADRRRVNGPAGGTAPPVFAIPQSQAPTPRLRTRAPNALRKMFLKTGITPSASGSAYLELETPSSNPASPDSPRPAGLKLACTVHGPRPLPRSAPFSPHLILSTNIKYAPFASAQRRGYVRDTSERDLAVHLETALRGVIIGDRWPKSGVDVIITILESEDDGAWDLAGGGMKAGRGPKEAKQWNMMNALGGCITVAAAAIADAGIDCVDVVAGGVAAKVRDQGGIESIVLDPVPAEHQEISAACVVGYLPARDEITDLWIKGDIGTGMVGNKSAYEELADDAVQAAMGSHQVLTAALKETAQLRLRS